MGVVVGVSFAGAGRRPGWRSATAVDAAQRRRRAPRTRRCIADGLPRRVPGHVQEAVRGAADPRLLQGQGRQAGQAGPPPRPPRPQPLRGRHGEVHRLRAVRRRVPRPLHLRARRRQPARRPGLAGRALRLHLRDQLPAVHPLRPVRGGVPDRGDHRVEAVRVQLHQPQRRHLHQGRAGGGRRRPAPAAAVGGLVRHRRRRPADLGVDAGHVAQSGAPTTRAGCSGRASWASACARPSRASRCRSPRPTPARPTPSSATPASRRPDRRPPRLRRPRRRRGQRDEGH